METVVSKINLLKNTFVHLKGISDVGEAKLWLQGVRTWDDLRLYHEKKNSKKSFQILTDLDASENAIVRQDLQFFCSRLKSNERWRLIPYCSDNIAYLDIESTGTGYPPVGASTVIAIYFKGELYQEHEPSLKIKLLDKICNEASMLCTFNGACFDLPFLEHEYHMSFRHMPHLDLRPWMRKLGFSGGLKKIQKQFSQIPVRNAMDIDGYDAVILWQWHLQGVEGALETLYTYNAEDTWVLEPLLIHGYNLETIQRSSLQLEALSLPKTPEWKTQVSEEIYNKLQIRKQSYWS